MIDSITILGGCGKLGEAEPVRRIEMKMGDVVSIVGPTGSGKTTLINDIELFADGNTPTGRRILINGSDAADGIPRRPGPEPDRPDHAAHDVSVRPAGERVPAARTRESAVDSPEPSGRSGGTDARFRQPAHRRTDPGREPDDGAFRRADAGAADRRRDDPLQHADRAAGRGGERGHPSDARAGAAAGVSEDLHLRHPRSAHRAAFGLPDRDEARDGDPGDPHGRGGAKILAAREKLDDILSRLRDRIRHGERIVGQELEGLA